VARSLQLFYVLRKSRMLLLGIAISSTSNSTLKCRPLDPGGGSSQLHVIAQLLPAILVS
jgi:hypothetical protein